MKLPEIGKHCDVKRLNILGNFFDNCFSKMFSSTKTPIIDFIKYIGNNSSIIWANVQKDLSSSINISNTPANMFIDYKIYQNNQIDEIYFLQIKIYLFLLNKKNK